MGDMPSNIFNMQKHKWNLLFADIYTKCNVSNECIGFWKKKKVWMFSFAYKSSRVSFVKLSTDLKCSLKT